MNVISRAPRWAQPPTQSFAEQGKVPGTATQPMDQDSFQDSFKLAAGAISLASIDEVPGEDDALGQPGVVRRNGLTLYYEGDSSSSSKGEVEAVLLGRRRGVEYVTYVHTRPNSFSTLQMVNDEGSIEVNGSQAQRTREGIDGYLISGNL